MVYDEITQTSVSVDVVDGMLSIHDPVDLTVITSYPLPGVPHFPKGLTLAPDPDGGPNYVVVTYYPQPDPDAFWGQASIRQAGYSRLCRLWMTNWFYTARFVPSTGTSLPWVISPGILQGIALSQQAFPGLKPNPDDSKWGRAAYTFTMRSGTAIRCLVYRIGADTTIYR